MTDEEYRKYEKEKRTQLIELIGDIAHHWRQPLSSISVSADSIKLNHELGILTDEDLIDSLDRITQSTQFLSTTLNTFKRFIEDEGNYQIVNLNDIIHNIVEMINIVFDGNEIKLIQNISDENMMINIIPLDFVQAIMNILNNANDVLSELDLTQKNIIITTIKENNKAIITIEDNGGGIDDTIISKVFNPYFTTKHKSQSTGLGLYIANKYIVEKFNGNIYVNNTTQGAKFTIELSLEL